jgi:flagellar basal body-associated protein FliL
VEEKQAKRLKSIVLMALALMAVLAGVGIMVDAASDSQLEQNTAAPRTEKVTPSPPNDTPIGAEGGPYR